MSERSERVKTWKILLISGAAGLGGAALIIAGLVAVINHYALTV